MAKGSSRERREEREQQAKYKAERDRRAALTPEERAREDYAQSRQGKGGLDLQDILMPRPGSGSPNDPLYTVKTPDEEYEQLWTGYLGFRKQIGGSYTQNVASASIRMAAGGLKPGSQEWESTLSRLDKRYESDIENIQAGETYDMLREHAKKKGESDVEEWYKKEWGGDVGAPKRYQERQAGVPQYQSKLVGGGATIGGPSTIV